MNKELSERVDKAYGSISNIQARASADHEPGTAMVRGAFGEYLILSSLKALISDLVEENNKMVMRELELSRSVIDLEGKVASLERVQRHSEFVMASVIRERDEVRDTLANISHLSEDLQRRLSRNSQDRASERNIR
jgi:hypothetical protein